jgi:hypothetical protein
MTTPADQELAGARALPAADLSLRVVPDPPRHLAPALRYAQSRSKGRLALIGRDRGPKYLRGAVKLCP